MTDRRVRPGPRNSITDVPGILVGNAEDWRVRSGVTVIVPDQPAVAGCDVRGGAPGTRETDALDPTCLVDAVHGVALSGGSVFGLEAASGVVRWLAARGRGFRFAPGLPCSPVVPGAILFDLANGGDKDWGAEPPYLKLGLAACAALSAGFALGNAGAGLGAMAGIYKGGLGTASAVDASGLVVGALVAANAAGSPVVPGTGAFWAWMLEQDGEFGGARPPADFGPIDLDLPADSKFGARGPAHTPRPGTNTTIGVVATNAALTPAEAKRIAIMAQDGLARAVRPIHTPVDGDALFVLGTGNGTADGTRTVTLAEPRPVALARLGAIAADCVARALSRGVYEAESLGGARSYRAVCLDLSAKV